jgi:two-component system sensor histidine kinase KdpD
MVVPAIRAIGESAIVDLPPPPTFDIKEKLLEQQRLMRDFTTLADAFLTSRPGDREYSANIAKLTELTGALQTVTNDAVTLLDEHSESETTTNLQLDVLVAVVMVLSGALLTRGVIATNHVLEKESNERQRAEMELRKSEQRTVEALRESDALKSALLSSVSHELRTPLTSIKVMVNGLYTDKTSMSEETRTEFLLAIDNKIDYLNRLVGNLLDMSRIEAGTLMPQRECHLLDDLVEGAIRCVGKPLQHRTLEVEVPSEPLPIYVDGVQIQQVIVNLLDNAVKYSEEGSCIRLRAAATTDQVEVRIENRGPGIGVSDLDKVFERFYRIQRENERVAGTGLGLAICKGIIKAHGGHIWAESTPGQTTIFVFTLPLTSPSMPSLGGQQDQSEEA